MHRPQRGDRRGATPATNGVILRARLLRAAGRSRDGSSSLLESGSGRRLRWGPSRERTANGRQ